MFRRKWWLFILCWFVFAPSSDAAVGDAVQEGSPCGGDLVGTYPNCTVGPNAVTLGTDTTGNYVGQLTAGTNTTLDNCTPGAGVNCTINSSVGGTAGGGLTGTYPNPSVFHAPCVGADNLVNGEAFHFSKARNAARTILAADCLCAAGTTATMTLQECDANGGACANTEAAMNCSSTNTAEGGGSIDAPNIEAGNWMRVLIGSPSGTGLCTFCVRYREP